MTTDTIYRPGLEGVVAGETAISTIEGGLRYRGYAVEELAENATFEETAHLILYGELPTAPQLETFRRRLGEFSAVAPAIIDILQAIPSSAPMMDVMRTAASLLAHWDPDTADGSTGANLRKAERLLAQLPVLMAARHRLRSGQEPIPPDTQLSLAGNVLWMLRGERPDSRHERAMDVSLILYAEHEYNASTFTARVVCSTLSDLHSAVTAAIGALKGPLHGGANERVMEVLEEVGSPENAERWIRAALDQKRRIMGFGHRVYKTGDPRARFLKPLCAELARASGNEKLEQTAEIIERIVGEEKKLPPNLDWPSARLYSYLGLPLDLYTPLFVVSRVVGWSAHAVEQLANNRLIRPRANYTGPGLRKWKPVEER
jgi:2-methylcitrate synthase/citrate synthase II